jgi:hypothetical protein
MFAAMIIAQLQNSGFHPTIQSVGLADVPVEVEL